jgi:hypothetical protein
VAEDPREVVDVARKQIAHIVAVVDSDSEGRNLFLFIVVRTYLLVSVAAVSHGIKRSKGMLTYLHRAAANGKVLLKVHHHDT